MVGMPIEKQCNKCGSMRPLETGFYVDKRTKDGRSGWCIKCQNENVIKNELRRSIEPMSLRAMGMEELYKARFRVISRA